MALSKELNKLYPGMNNYEQFFDMRKYIEEVGVEQILSELQHSGTVDTNGDLTTGVKPFNPFARYQSGIMSLSKEILEEQEFLGDYKELFMICANKPENDLNWDKSGEWLGVASMSKKHRFLLTKNMHWRWFNVLVFGLVSFTHARPAGIWELNSAQRMLTKMRDAAILYTKHAGWSGNIGLYFHVYGHNSVNALHLHIVDLEVTGPTYEYLKYKNLSLDSVLEVIEAEIREIEAKVETVSMEA